jgi:hypothetical protein
MCEKYFFLKSKKMGANALGTMFLSLSGDFWQIFIKKSEKVLLLHKRKERSRE